MTTHSTTTMEAPDMRFALSLMLILALTACAAPATDLPAAEDDLAAVEAVEQAYVAGWLQNDPDAVMALFGEDAVLLPPGREPVRGHADMRAYWWPEDGETRRSSSRSTQLTVLRRTDGGWKMVRRMWSRLPDEG